MASWHIYQKDATTPHDDIVKKGRLPESPKWRNFKERREEGTRGSDYQPSDHEVEMINTSLYLRRPLLITGNPGSGKSSLAYAVAWQLKLGNVLWWPINSRSALEEGLYNYDALGRLRDLNTQKIEGEISGSKTGQDDPAGEESEQTDAHWSQAERIGRYIRLGPLGTALYGGDRPRVLLIDEIDKSDIDLPNDLLHVLEEAAFDIPELQRMTPDDTDEKDDQSMIVNVYPHDENKHSKMVPIPDGRVECTQFPLIILTSNGERELPPAFKRRCLTLNIDDPKGTRLRDIVKAHIKEAVRPAENGKQARLVDDVEALVASFETKRDDGKALLATDQLLNAIFVITRKRAPTGDEWNRIRETILRELGSK